MIDKIIFFFDKDVFLRIITGIFFVVPFVLFILNGGYLFIFYFLLLLAIIIEELNSTAVKKISFKLRFLLISIITLSIFHFIFLRISYDSNIIQYIFYVIFSIWIFDSFSLIGGKLIGGKKLMPLISPNKTYSGLMFGFLSILIFSITFICAYDINNLLIISTIVIGSVSFLGDAAESYLKRHLNIKDFSNLLPGHGGFLDRMDAFILIFFAHLILMSLNIITVNLYA